MNYPKVSFLTTSFNNKLLLEKTMKSILEQDYPNLEHVIIDGGSTDGTIELLKHYEPLYKGNLIWISEPDKGISDALNKAHKIMSGEYVIGGSDPLINKSVITMMLKNILEGDYDGCFGGLITVDDNRIIRKWSGKAGHIRLGWIPATPTLCMKRNVVEKYGSFNLKYKVVADYDCSIKIFLSKEFRFVAIEEPLVLFQAGGSSNGGLKANLFGIMEGHQALKDNGVKFAFITDILRIVRSLWQYRFSITRKEYKL